jgi:hypothetical protein
LQLAARIAYSVRKAPISDRLCGAGAIAFGKFQRTWADAGTCHLQTCQFYKITSHKDVTSYMKAEEEEEQEEIFVILIYF